MFEVISNDILAPNLHRLVVHAPRVAMARRPGQFVIVRGESGDERIPLTIGDANPAAGTITLFIQAVGASTRKIVAIPAGGFIRDVAGPLGKPTHLGSWEKVACVGGGVGTAVLYPLVKALSERGTRITTIIGGRSRQVIILAEELAALSETLLITTEDGSQGRKGFVTAELSDMVTDPLRTPQAVFAVGPVPMMRAIAELTRPYGIETIVSLNPIMIDGTGMCGVCRLTVAGSRKFACVDGPEFDAQEVDWDEVLARRESYAAEEVSPLRRSGSASHF
ncbi:MAG TPA: sulfide/dihydroorotate dehydrogenase-like FAD/NAD-binding protein, partial [Geobacteraceae bacterium]|nr:sulfide/dihydroorotate dehydrogenase-like FAD/NAD-binding protein [Geobacteraceae bacterium]